MKHSEIIQRVLHLLRPRLRAILSLIALIVVATSFDIAVPFISQKLIDQMIGFFKNGGRAPVFTLVAAAAAILFFTVANRIIRSSYDFRLFELSTQAEDDLKHRAYEKYLNLHSLFHHNASSGQIIGRIDRGTTSIFNIMYNIVGQNVLPPLIVFIGVLAALSTKQPILALIVFLPLPIYLFVVQRLTRKIYEIERQAHEEFEAVVKEEYDVAGNVLTVKKFSQEHIEIENQKELQKRARATQYKAEKLWDWIQATQTFIATTGRISIVLIAGFLVFRGRSTIGEFVLYLTLQNMAYGPAAQLSVLLPSLRRNLARAERLFELLEEPIRVTDAPNASPLPPLTKTIEFQNVGFHYTSGRWALRSINLEIEAHTTVALVGRSGSGKTTFINLLLRSFDPQEGAIMIDGHDLRDVTQKSLRDQIAVVPQEVDLFSRTVCENIGYGKPSATEEEVVRAAKTALAHDFIMKLDRGYDTIVGERGIKLSGGERQRIGIARAVLRDPKILILDEATSHLDTESERLIQKATEALMKNRTTIIIAHRLSTIFNADMILVFGNNRIETTGTHRTLLKTSPTYRKLYELQFVGTK